MTSLRHSWRGSQGVAIVSARFAKEAWGTRTTGRLIQIGNGVSPRSVVGVVADVRDLQSGSRGLTAEPRADIYLPMAQAATDLPQILIRTHEGSTDLRQRLKGALKALNLSVPIPASRTLLQVFDGDFRAVRIMATLFGTFALAATMLSAIGVYAVVRFNIGIKYREIGIRSALGCTPRELTMTLLGRELSFVVAGVIVGGVLATLVPSFLGAFVLGVSGGISGAILSTAGLFLTCAVLACYPHARQAAHTQPAHVLRGL